MSVHKPSEAAATRSAGAVDRHQSMSSLGCGRPWRVLNDVLFRPIAGMCGRKSRDPVPRAAP